MSTENDNFEYISIELIQGLRRAAYRQGFKAGWIETGVEETVDIEAMELYADAFIERSEAHGPQTKLLKLVR